MMTKLEKVEVEVGEVFEDVVKKFYVKIERVRMFVSFDKIAMRIFAKSLLMLNLVLSCCCSCYFCWIGKYS